MGAVAGGDRAGQAATTARSRASGGPGFVVQLSAAVHPGGVVVGAVRRRHRGDRAVDRGGHAARAERHRHAGRCSRRRRPGSCRPSGAAISRRPANRATPPPTGTTGSCACCSGCGTGCAAGMCTCPARAATPIRPPTCSPPSSGSRSAPSSAAWSANPLIRPARWPHAVDELHDALGELEQVLADGDGPVRLDETGDLVISPLTAEDVPARRFR